MQRKQVTASSALALLLITAGGRLGAQAAPQPPGTTPPSTVASSDSSTDTIQLSPFTVSGEDDHGYQATATLAGTRIRTDLRDIGAAISVVTKDFIQDTGVTSNATLLTYTTNTEVGGVHGNYSGFGNGKSIGENLINPQSTTRVRGLDSADNTRDYFLSDVPWDSYNIDRIDTVRGPNSILYGLGSPAGIINTTLNEANFRNHTSIEARYGRFNSYRGSVDTNIVLLPDQLSLRLDGVYSDTKYQEKPAENKDRRGYAALKYAPKALNNDTMTTVFKVNVDHGKIDSNNPRTSPPVDAITPWFTALNKQAFDPFLAWVTNGSGPTWTPRGIITGVPTGQGQGADAQGNPNPNYQPYISSLGSGNSGAQGGVTYLQGYGAQVPGGYTYWQPSLSTPNNSSATGGSINGISYNQPNGIATYDNYAQNAKLPNYQTGLYKQSYITDPTIFNFYDQLIDGNNAKQWQGWTSSNASLAQTFFSDRFGYEVAVHQEKYHNGQESLFGGAGIGIEVDEYDADGAKNPNFGKPFITGTGQYGNSSTQHERNDLRVTAYGEVRGSDFFQRESLAARLIGTERFTGLYSTDSFKTEDRNWQQYATDNVYNVSTLQAGQIPQIGSFAPHVIEFLGNSLANASSASGANLSSASTLTLPSSGSIEQWVPKWTAGPSVDPAGVWTPPAGQGGKINSDNPANYQGWTTVPVNILNANTGDIDQLYTGGQKSKTQVSSSAIIWQGFIADNTIIPLIGIRKDTVKTSYAQPDRNPDGSYAINDPSYQLGSVSSESGTTRTYSVVLHLPQSIRSKLPLGMDASVFYNRSANFEPGAGRSDLYGDLLPNPNGKTKDYGVLLSFLDQRISLKINHFDTVNVNATDNSLSGPGYLGRDIEIDYNFYMTYKNNYGQDWQRHFNPWSSQTQAQADAQQAAAVSAWDGFLQDPDVKRLWTAWKIAQNPLGWQTDSQTNQAPAGFASTHDTESKGYEYELTTQITKQWTLTANASHSTATESNVGGAALTAFVNKFDKFVQGPGGDIRLWWGGSTTTALTDWDSNFKSAWSLAQIGAGSDVSELRPWHFNLITNYRFDDRALKGFNFGGAYRWESRDIIGYPVTLDENNVYHYDLSQPYRGPANTAVDLWAGYDLKLNKKTTLHFQLNVRNVFADKKLIPVSVQPNGQVAAYRIPDPFGWEFTTRYDF